MKFDAVIFDFDGVIVETDSLNYKVFETLFKKYKLSFNRKVYKNFFFGKKLTECVPFYFSKFGRKAESDFFIKEKIDLFDSLYKDNVTIFEDSLNLLGNIFGKIPLAIVTGTRKRPLSIAFEMFDLEKYFDTYITAEDYLKGKPHPESYNLIAKKLNISPKNMMVIEDSPVGVDAAVASGAFCIGVTHTHSNKDLIKSQRIVSSLEELKSFFTFSNG